LGVPASFVAVRCCAAIFPAYLTIFLLGNIFQGQEGFSLRPFTLRPWDNVKKGEVSRNAFEGYLKMVPPFHLLCFLPPNRKRQDTFKYR
jgi:hypothetical protein